MMRICWNFEVCQRLSLRPGFVLKCFDHLVLLEVPQNVTSMKKGCCTLGPLVSISLVIAFINSAKGCRPNIARCVMKKMENSTA